MVVRGTRSVAMSGEASVHYRTSLSHHRTARDTIGRAARCGAVGLVAAHDELNLRTNGLNTLASQTGNKIVAILQ